MEPPPPTPDRDGTLARASDRALRKLARGGRRYALPWLSIRRWMIRLQFVGAALLAGLIAILFAIGAELAIGTHAGIMAELPWLTLIVAPAGFALMAWVSRTWFPGAQGSGIPQAIAAIESDDGQVRKKLLSMRLAIAKVFLTLGGLLSGASIGREGPSVQIGASVMSLIAGKKTRRIANSRDLMIAGGGAGVAAAFNTPLGGIMFAIEELCRFHPFRANSTTLIAVIFAGLMSLAVLGNYTYFGRTPAAIDWPDSVWPILLCGAIGGLLGGGFSRLLVASSRGLPGRLGELSNNRPVAFAALCGLGTALIGLATGGLTYGTGYAESKAALEGAAQLPVYFLVAKMAVIWLAFLSRIPGGVFAPALAVGAGMGANIGLMLPPEHGSAILVLGMVGFLAGVTQTPITSFVIVMEMTANHQMLLPLMATAVVAHAFSKTVAQTPLYHALAYPTLRKVEAEVRSRHHAHAAAGGAVHTVPLDTPPPEVPASAPTEPHTDQPPLR